MMSKVQKEEYVEALASLLTVGDWVRFAATAFSRAEVYFGHGTDNAWDEAVHLVLQMLRLCLDASPTVAQARVTPTEAKAIVNAIETRIETRKPLPYITHQAYCLGLPFYVDERVLIPRSPIAEWIGKCFEPWIEAWQVGRILEIGTGSACLAIIAALQFPNAEVDAVDLSEDALVVATMNVARHQLVDQVNLLQGDVYEPVGGRLYDIIFSNPPYVGAEEMASLPPEYRFEPHMALEAEDNGLAIVEKIIAGAASHLHPNGILVVEVGNSEHALVQAYPEAPFIWLEQERGGHGIFLLTRDQLQAEWVRGRQ